MKDTPRGFFYFLVIIAVVSVVELYRRVNRQQVSIKSIEQIEKLVKQYPPLQSKYNEFAQDGVLTEAECQQIFVVASRLKTRELISD